MLPIVTPDILNSKAWDIARLSCPQHQCSEQPLARESGNDITTAKRKDCTHLCKGRTTKKDEMVAFLSRPNFSLQKSREECHELNLDWQKGPQNTGWHVTDPVPCATLSCPRTRFAPRPAPSGGQEPSLGGTLSSQDSVLPLAIWIITSNCSSALFTLQSFPHLLGLSCQLNTTPSFHHLTLWISLVQRDSRIFPGDKGHSQRTGNFPKAHPLPRKQDRDQSVLTMTHTSLCICTAMCKALLHSNQKHSAHFRKCYYF